MIFKLLSNSGDSVPIEPSKDGVSVDSDSTQTSGELSTSMQDRLDQLEEMRGAISGFAESGHGGSTGNGHIRRLGHLNALVSKMEAEARRTADLETARKALKAENAELRQAAFVAEEKATTNEVLLGSLNNQLSETRQGLAAATTELDRQTQLLMRLEAKAKSRQERLGKQKTTIDSLNESLETEKAERIIAARAAKDDRKALLDAERSVAEAKACVVQIEKSLEKSNKVLDAKRAVIKELRAEIKSLKVDAVKKAGAHRSDCDAYGDEIKRLEKALATSKREIVSAEKRHEQQREKLAAQSTKIKGLRAANSKLAAEGKKTRPAVHNQTKRSRSKANTARRTTKT